GLTVPEGALKPKQPRLARSVVRSVFFNLLPSQARYQLLELFRAPFRHPCGLLRFDFDSLRRLRAKASNAAIPKPASAIDVGSGTTGDAPKMAVALGSTSVTKLVLPFAR